MDINNYLDFKDIIINELFGDIWLFVFVGFIVLIYVGLKSRFPTEVVFLFSIIFMAMAFMHTGLDLLWVLTVLGVGTLFYFKIQKAIRQG